MLQGQPVPDLAAQHRALFVALDAPLAVVIPLGLAMLVNDPIPGRALFRSALRTPLMISVASVGVLWQWFYNPAFGLINYYARSGRAARVSTG